MGTWASRDIYIYIYDPSTHGSKRYKTLRIPTVIAFCPQDSGCLGDGLRV